MYVGWIHVYPCVNYDGSVEHTAIITVLAIEYEEEVDILEVLVHGIFGGNQL